MSKSTKKLATKIMKKLIDDPLNYLLNFNCNLHDCDGEPQFRFMLKNKLIAINCDEEGYCMVGVIDESGVETAKGFSEKLSILMYMMYEDIYINRGFEDAA
jgi:hypothetical protein